MVSISPRSAIVPARNTTFGANFLEEVPLHRLALIGASLLLAGACSSTTKTVSVEPSPQQRSTASASASAASNHASTAATLGVPPGHLPQAGECRVWIPGTPPGKQPRPKSRSCAGIASVAPAGSWVIYRPTADKKIVHVRHVDSHRAGSVVRVQVFDIATQRLMREERP